MLVTALLVVVAVMMMMRRRTTTTAGRDICSNCVGNEAGAGVKDEEE